jgi:hypothetical protein
MIGNKLLQSERLCTTSSVSAARREGRGLQCSSFSQQARALPGMDLGGREHVEAGVRMHVVVPRIELAEIVFSLGQGREVTWEGWLGFDGGKVGFDVGVVVGRARPAERAAGCRVCGSRWSSSANASGHPGR